MSNNNFTIVVEKKKKENYNKNDKHGKSDWLHLLHNRILAFRVTNFRHI